MGGQAEEKERKKRICVGLLAHVDAGKTTLSEALLYTAGALRKLGRVDHGDAFLDNFSLERERGITIFSKQAQLLWKGMEVTLLDTPGHVDFSAEMERTLRVLDYCVLVISGSDGVQGHTGTLWKLLKQYEIPVFLFINKMDQPDTDRTRLLRELQARLDGGCLEFGPNAEAHSEFWEELSMCSEELLEEYLETGTLAESSVQRAVARRQIFPCYFGSALRLEGVEELLDGLCRYTGSREYPEEFGARVYKISRDPAGNRLTHLKVTGGTLRVKMSIRMPEGSREGASSGEEYREEKADLLRVYEGAGFRTVEKVEAGGICAVAGFTRTYAGQGLGYEKDSEGCALAPVLSYRLALPPGTDEVKALGQLRRLEEEEPQLHVVWQERLREIHVQVMGEVQTEILKRLILERFGLEVEFADGRLLYRETITGPVEGIGHFEPLRHYAEVHLLLEPGEPGSGLAFESACGEDQLDRNWQRLILTHLEEKTHLGVLTGSPITDMKITLLAGRAHLKHTEGGDFRQATYRALRQGLMQAESVLLEPVLAFTLELPTEQLGRAMSDIRRMCGRFDPPVTTGESSVITGSAPAATIRDYQREVNAYTRGRGRFSCVLKGYEPCHNAEQVIGETGYDPDADQENPSSSVFCAHGAGFLVNWREVPNYAHVESGWQPPEAAGNSGSEDGRESGSGTRGKNPQPEEQGRTDHITLEEIEAIFQQTYRKSIKAYEPYRVHKRNNGGGSGQEEAAGFGKQTGAGGQSGLQRHSGKTGDREEEESYFLVDGYNIIFAWEDLRSLAETNIDGARDRLMDVCCNFQGCDGATLILVFDAYKVKGNPGSVQKYHNIYVVYTKEAETADQYIEKTVHRIGKKHRVTVATSDALEQMIIWGAGATRLSARGFREAIEEAALRMRENFTGDGRLSNRIRVPEEHKIAGESGQDSPFRG
ncbi:MAG: TetM/TetW/TetO/TetS family tetracycline resistance ribosomal protection protein [bacterium]|nr:TetM/TetW/TetO/TetS family tetracycline resistance ribosomal protection protein [bacterium]